MGGLDIAGVVGTWVATGVAIIALLGVVGPILGWQASRTERQKAIMAIGKNNGGLVSSGVPFWPGVRLGQMVRAPRISKAKRFSPLDWKNFDSVRIKTYPDSSTTWVHFAAFLRAHDVVPKGGDVIKIHNKAALLPVHKYYLWIFGLLGRFCDIKERKHRSAAPAMRRWDSSRQRPRFIEVRMPSRPIYEDSLDSYSDRDQHGPELHGLTGSSLRSRRKDSVLESWTISFVPVSILGPLEIPVEAISLETMAMLSFGFWPFSKDVLISFLDPPEQDQQQSSEDEVLEPPVHTFDTRRYLQRPSTYDRRRAPKNIFKSANRNVRAFELSDVAVELEIMQCLEPLKDTKHLALNDLVLTRETRKELLECSDQTYVPATMPWIRLKESTATATGERVDIYIKRADAQRMALALLNLPWLQRCFVQYLREQCRS